EGEDDGVLEPVKSLDHKYFHSRFSTGPVNHRGDHGRQGEEVEEDQGMRVVMEEIDHFDGGVIPTQPQ
ncbi:hypothetical protein A2U01_0097421, partial [Trifolium medium]|nr:hypothetical protein [Trifolium medium]